MIMCQNAVDGLLAVDNVQELSLNFFFLKRRYGNQLKIQFNKNLCICIEPQETISHEMAIIFSILIESIAK